MRKESLQQWADCQGAWGDIQTSCPLLLAERSSAPTTLCKGHLWNENSVNPLAAMWEVQIFNLKFINKILIENTFKCPQPVKRKSKEVYLRTPASFFPVEGISLSRTFYRQCGLSGLLSLYLLPLSTTISIQFLTQEAFITFQFWIENQEGPWSQNFVFNTFDLWQIHHSLDFSLHAVNQLWVAGSFLHQPNQYRFLQGSELTQFSLNVDSCLVDLPDTHMSLFTKEF